MSRRDWLRLCEGRGSTPIRRAAMMLSSSTASILLLQIEYGCIVVVVRHHHHRLRFQKVVGVKSAESADAMAAEIGHRSKAIAVFAAHGQDLVKFVVRDGGRVRCPARWDVLTPDTPGQSPRWTDWSLPETRPDESGGGRDLCNLARHSRRTGAPRGSRGSAHERRAPASPPHRSARIGDQRKKKRTSHIAAALSLSSRRPEFPAVLQRQRKILRRLPRNDQPKPVGGDHRPPAHHDLSPVITDDGR